MEPARNAIAVYRELAPCRALAGHVYAFFTFAPAAASTPMSRRVLREIHFGPSDSFCSPLFADGSVSLVLTSGRTCELGRGWRPDPAGPAGRLIGPMTMVGKTEVRDSAEAVGVYFRPGQASVFLGMPTAELADRVVGLDDVWGAPAARPLALDDWDLGGCAGVDRIEAALLVRLARESSRIGGIDAAGLAARVLGCAGRVTVERLASAAGVSRQHLTRVFRERVGLAPKSYCSLARFQAGLAYAGRDGVDWAQAAAALGYADQSHMIAEFRRFSGLTPQTLAAGRWFNPFIERARSRAHGNALHVSALPEHD